MGKLIILRGLPGSGKTTWAKDYQSEEGHEDVVRVNRDELRAMLHGRRPWDIVDERLTRQVRDACITTALAQGWTVIADDTNLEAYHISELEALVQAQGATVEVVTLTPSLEECIRRDRHRAISVGEQRIREMAATSEWDIYASKSEGT